MPTSIPLAVLVTLVAMIFSAGVTWGIMTTRQRSGEEKQKTSDGKVDEVVKDLKEAVKKIEHLVTEYQVMKASSVRVEKVSDQHEERLSALEIAVAKINSRRRKT